MFSIYFIKTVYCFGAAKLKPNLLHNQLPTFSNCNKIVIGNNSLLLASSNIESISFKS